MCEVTADGDIIVGRPRPKNNPLIHHSEVGKPAFHNDLPPLPPGYTFGAPLKRDPEGAGDVMLTWQEHRPPAHKTAYDFGRDYVTLNRRALAAGCLGPREVADFRRANEARIKPRVNGERPSVVPDHVKRDKTHTYGAVSEPSEHVADLIQNRYELEWVLEQKARHEQLSQAQQREAARRKLARSMSRNNSPLARRSGSRLADGSESGAAAAAAAAPHPKEWFTMRQFRDVPSRYFTPSPALPPITPEPSR